MYLDRKIYPGNKGVPNASRSSSGHRPFIETAKGVPTSQTLNGKNDADTQKIQFKI
jgi:hypothetical protein